MAFNIVPVVRQKSYGNQHKTCFWALFYKFSADSLKSIVIPDGVTRIGNSAFQNCSSLICIIIPDSVTHIGKRAFSGCTEGLFGLPQYACGCLE